MAEPAEEQPPTTTQIPIFSKIVDTCLDDIKNVSNLWYPLIQSGNLETPKTLAGLSFKALLNESLKTYKIKKQVERILEGELIDLSKVPYLESHPELIQSTLKAHIAQLNGPLTIEIHKTKCRLLVYDQLLAEIPISKKFKWPLVFAHFATEIELTQFELSVKDDYAYRKGKSRGEVLDEFLWLCKTSSISVEGKCIIECYDERKEVNDEGCTVYLKFEGCANTSHRKYTFDAQRRHLQLRFLQRMQRIHEQGDQMDQRDRRRQMMIWRDMYLAL